MEPDFARKKCEVGNSARGFYVGQLGIKCQLSVNCLIEELKINFGQGTRTVRL
jgi:hypothetical protein